MFLFSYTVKVNSKYHLASVNPLVYFSSKIWLSIDLIYHLMIMSAFFKEEPFFPFWIKLDCELRLSFMWSSNASFFQNGKCPHLTPDQKAEWNPFISLKGISLFRPVTTFLLLIIKMDTYKGRYFYIYTKNLKILHWQMAINKRRIQRETQREMFKTRASGSKTHCFGRSLLGEKLLNITERRIKLQRTRAEWKCSRGHSTGSNSCSLLSHIYFSSHVSEAIYCRVQWHQYAVACEATFPVRVHKIVSHW